MLSSCSKRLLFHDTSASWSLRLAHGNYNELIRDVSWSDDGKYLLQVNPKGLVEILSATETEVKSLQHIPLRETWAACFHRDGHRNVAVGCKTGQVQIWDTKYKNTPKIFPLPNSPAPVNIISYNAKNTNVAASMQNGDITIYGLTSNSLVSTVRVSRSQSISAMKFHHESRSILGLATDEGHVILKDITTNKDKVCFKNIHTSPVSDFAYSLINRDVLLSCGYDKIVRVYDVRIGNVVSNIETNYPLSSISINIDNQVALGTRKGVILIYDLRDLHAPISVLDDHTGEIKRVAFQPLRKRTVPTELSLKEESIQTMSPSESRSPLSARTPDIFMVGDTPSPKPQSESRLRNEVEEADSFLCKLGLDQSNVNESYLKNTIDPKFANKLNTTDLQMHRREPDSIAKSSTPLAGKTGENFLTPSSLCEPLSSERKNRDASPVHDIALLDEIQSKQNNEVLIRELGEELKDVIKMSVADLADDSKNYYLSLLMQLTKQKIFMEKQMSAIMLQMQNMQHNQDVLAEANIKLAMEIELLKSNSAQSLR